ncbi:hypothetical protein [Pigmentiphaga litoralis]|uniref:hypothetical protein n=1 Tax=Pigmentiphaga litoralis TaxID=516702 RepID=UPI003B429218
MFADAMGKPTARYADSRGLSVLLARRQPRLCDSSSVFFVLFWRGPVIRGIRRGIRHGVRHCIRIELAMQPKINVYPTKSIAQTCGCPKAGNRSGYEGNLPPFPLTRP